MYIRVNNGDVVELVPTTGLCTVGLTLSPCMGWGGGTGWMDGFLEYTMLKALSLWNWLLDQLILKFPTLSSSISTPGPQDMPQVPHRLPGRLSLHQSNAAALHLPLQSEHQTIHPVQV